MYYQVGTRYQPCAITVKISSLTAFRLRLQAFDATQASTFLIDQVEAMQAGEERTFEIPMPVCGNHTWVCLYDEAAGERDAAAETSFRVLSVRKCGLRQHEELLPLLDQAMWVFIDFAQRFTYNAGWMTVNAEGLCYASPNKRFKIEYLDTIRNKNGVQEPTPARINRDTGIIQAARDKLVPMTQPGRMVILVHEYSHLNENQDPEFELEADLNAIYICLSLGYSAREIISTYRRIFYSVDTPINRERMHHIMEFISKFDNQFNHS